MKVIVFAFLFFACAGSSDGGGGSTGPSETAPGSGAPLVTDSDSAKAAIGKTVRVTGTALNAKLGPVVSTGGLVIYCFGKQEWSDELGNQITVTGILEQTDELRAEVGPDGEQTAGTGGRDWLIRDCRDAGAATAKD